MPYKPGQSGNPGGRPRGAAGFAAKISAATRDGDEIVETLLEHMRSGSRRESLQASQILAAYHAGKPEATLNVRRETEVPADWDRLTDAQRSVFVASWKSGAAS